MNTTPLISIIVPAYNSEKWLTECCRSVFSQTYPNIELIIINDGSTDETHAIATALAVENKNVKVIHTENGGVCRARNTGLEAATGEYITFLDADDVLIDDAIDILYSNMVKECADIAIGWKTNMTSDCTDIGCPYKKFSGVFVGTEALRLSLEDNPAMYAVWGKLYKRTAIDTIRFVEDKKVHEDSFFVFECLLKQPKVVICSNCVVRYRITENSASRSEFSKKFFDILYFAERKKHLINENHPQLSSLAENVLIKANMALLKCLVTTNNSTYKDSEKRAIKSVIEKKSYFRPATQSDSKWFWLITHRLYGLYKALYIFKKKIKMRRHQA